MNRLHLQLCGGSGSNASRSQYWCNMELYIPRLWSCGMSTFTMLKLHWLPYIGAIWSSTSPYFGVVVCLLLQCSNFTDYHILVQYGALHPHTLELWYVYFYNAQTSLITIYWCNMELYIPRLEWWYVYFYNAQTSLITIYWCNMELYIPRLWSWDMSTFTMLKLHWLPYIGAIWSSTSPDFGVGICLLLQCSNFTDYHILVQYGALHPQTLELWYVYFYNAQTSLITIFSRV